MKRIEGVSYYRFCIRYRLSDGRRLTMIRYSPGYPWVHEEITRELVERFGLDGIKPGSVTIRCVE
ncbi:MAG: hypothetical protein ACOY0T_35590 [Myxococcota bacterium]